MNSISKICNFLVRKKTLFIKYEAETNKMSPDNPEELNHYITNRGELAIEIDKIDAEIFALCEMEPERDLLLEAVGNRCDYMDLPEEFTAVYKASQEIFAIINRIIEKESAVLTQARLVREGLLEEIKVRQNIPKIKKYLTGLATKSETGLYLGSNNEKA